MAIQGEGYFSGNIFTVTKKPSEKPRDHRRQRVEIRVSFAI